jgi:hypothetical protein
MVVVAYSNLYRGTSYSIHDNRGDNNTMILYALTWLWIIGLVYTVYSILYDSEQIDDNDAHF